MADNEYLDLWAYTAEKQYKVYVGYYFKFNVLISYPELKSQN